MSMKKTFRDRFKFYKRRNVSLDLSEVIDFNRYDEYQCGREGQQNFQLVICKNSNFGENFGLKSPHEWKVFKIITKQGLIFIKNPFKSFAHRYWSIRCLEYYTRKPNKLNIDAHGLIKNDEDWWEYCQKNHSTENGREVLKKLRWVTCGYHHNWDTKEYNEGSKSDIPQDLKELCSFLAEVLGFSNFNAEAAIINFYHFDSSLSGHTDHSEVNIKAPLFSFSFGQSAIFLIGGESLQDDALPVLIESGDILIMSGDSRLYFHGVPKILQAEHQVWNNTDKEQGSSFNNKYLVEEVMKMLFSKTKWEPFDSYLKKARININVRQVLNPGQTTLSHKSD